MKLDTQVGLGPGHIVLNGDPVPLPKAEQPPIFGPYLLWPHGRMDQDAIWYGGRPRRRRLCVIRWLPRSPSSKGVRAPPPKFRPISIVAKRLDASRWALGVEVGLSPGDFVLDGDPALPSQN